MSWDSSQRKKQVCIPQCSHPTHPTPPKGSLSCLPGLSLPPHIGRSGTIASPLGSVDILNNRAAVLDRKFCGADVLTHRGRRGKVFGPGDENCSLKMPLAYLNGFCVTCVLRAS